MSTGCGKSFLANTIARYFLPCSGTTNVDLVSSSMSTQAAVQSCHWYSNSIVGVPCHLPLKLTESVSPRLGDRVESVGLLLGSTIWWGGSKTRKYPPLDCVP